MSSPAAQAFAAKMLQLSRQLSAVRHGLEGTQAALRDLTRMGKAPPGAIRQVQDAQVAFEALLRKLGPVPRAVYGQSRDRHQDLWRCIHCGALVWPWARSGHLPAFHALEVEPLLVEMHFEIAPRPRGEK